MRTCRNPARKPHVRRGVKSEAYLAPDVQPLVAQPGRFNIVLEHRPQPANSAGFSLCVRHGGGSAGEERGGRMRKWWDAKRWQLPRSQPRSSACATLRSCADPDRDLNPTKHHEGANDGTSTQLSHPLPCFCDMSPDKALLYCPCGSQFNGQGFKTIGS